MSSKSEDSFYIPWEIYQNVLKYLTNPKYRGFSVSNTFTKTQFQKAMNANHFIYIIANTTDQPPTEVADAPEVISKRQSLRTKAAAAAVQSTGDMKYAMAKRNRILVVLLDVFTDASSESKIIPRSKGAFSDVMKFAPEAEEVIILSDKSVSSHVERVMDEIRKTGSIVHNYFHRMFSIEMPLCPLTSPHRILRGQELEDVLSHLHGEASGQPKIYANKDPQAIWIGATAGDLIRIDRLTESGLEVEFRYCI